MCCIIAGTRNQNSILWGGFLVGFSTWVVPRRLNPGAKVVHKLFRMLSLVLIAPTHGGMARLS